MLSCEMLPVTLACEMMPTDAQCAECYRLVEPHTR
jgi:hypothetical protein